jgi:dsRNA-specific ribonuclease
MQRQSLYMTLEQLFISANVKPKYINIIHANIREFERAFTSRSYDEHNNYEVYEFAGDPVAAAAMNLYFIRRFPQLKCTDGVRVLARLKINYGSRRSFSRIADSLGFWPHIRAAEEEKIVDREKLLEDVFEAFIGCTCFVLDDALLNGCGYSIVYEIIKSVFDKITISLEYEDLYDAKSRLNELFNSNPVLGKMVFIDEPRNAIVYSQVGNTRRKLAESGEARTKADRHQIASKIALDLLHSEGYALRQQQALFC